MLEGEKINVECKIRIIPQSQIMGNFLLKEQHFILLSKLNVTAHFTQHNLLFCCLKSHVSSPCFPRAAHMSDGSMYSYGKQLFYSSFFHYIYKHYKHSTNRKAFHLHNNHLRKIFFFFPSLSMSQLNNRKDNLLKATQLINVSSSFLQEGRPEVFT